jgi:hypothetical protein
MGFFFSFIFLFASVHPKVFPGVNTSFVCVCVCVCVFCTFGFFVGSKKIECDSYKG